MPEKNGKRDTQRTEQGYEIPVPKRKDVYNVFEKITKRRDDRDPKRQKRK